MEEETTKKVEIVFNTVELQKINLSPGDVLSAKLIGDEFDVETMESLKSHLTQVFPDNKIMVFAMTKNSDIVLEVVKKQSGYCSDCTCGKKESVEGA